SPVFHVYGFYDMTDVNLQVLSALSKRLDVRLYFPAPSTRGHSAFTFCRDFLNDIQARIGTSLLTRGDQDSRPATGLTDYFLKSFPDGEIRQPPKGLSVQRASGIRAEAISAAVRIRKWLDQQPGLQLHEIIVATPRLEAYYPILLEVFTSFAIPLRVSALPSQGSSMQRPIRMLYQIWREEGSVERILAYLRVFPSVAANWGIDHNHFEKKIRDLPVSSGPSWEKLAQIIKNPERRLPSQFTQNEAVLINEISELWITRPSDRTMNPAEAAQYFERVCFWLDDSKVLEPLEEELHQLRTLLPDLKLPLDLLWQLASQALEQGSYSEPLDEEAVTLVPIMRARGLTPKALVLLGLSGDQFPSKVDEDPFLSDLTRQQLIQNLRDVGFRLPLKGRATEEMVLLFYLLNPTAQSVHWVIPSTDEGGRTVSPTPWVFRYLKNWGKDCHGLSDGHISRSPVEQARHLTRMDESVGRYLPPDYGDLVRGFTRDRRKGGRSRLSSEPFEPIPSASKPLQERKRIRVTQLELLARCPFRFWAESLAEVAPLEPKFFTDRLDPMGRGSLLHSLLESLLGPAVELRGNQADLLKDCQLELDTLFEKLQGEYGYLLELAPPLIAEYHRRRLLEKVKFYLGQLASTELELGKIVSLEEKLDVKIGGLRVSGKIDRIEDRNGTLWVIDYKSGRYPWKKKDEERLQIEMGYLAQPILYPLLYAKTSELSTLPRFAFIYLGEDPPDEVSISSQVDGETHLEILSGFLDQLAFPPISNEFCSEIGLEALVPCRYCRMTSLCRRFENNLSDLLGAHKGSNPVRLKQMKKLGRSLS
ncbi:MAG: exodeoxyribonuclease V subunit gamma, partial [Acidobacteriota bacterium]